MGGSGENLLFFLIFSDLFWFCVGFLMDVPKGVAPNVASAFDNTKCMTASSGVCVSILESNLFTDILNLTTLMSTWPKTGPKDRHIENKSGKN